MLFTFASLPSVLFFKGLYCFVSLYNKQGMYNCSVYQLKTSLLYIVTYIRTSGSLLDMHVHNSNTNFITS
jgi:hypothetical protein